MTRLGPSSASCSAAARPSRAGAAQVPVVSGTSPGVGGGARDERARHRGEAPARDLAGTLRT
ncbi:hypothetical protein HMPREF0682_2584 [Propionibacterium acidifaciens F0233]|uniref:Uncharacterized protein n=1 Tax=Propionibacterium acidifaciens F0233 TaxID=553198 RepID=U2RXA2_9ACTN|nr:hypothetical protein HMPREF0682_2584 [Propionibacterium acidifaciens F0233]